MSVSANAQEVLEARYLQRHPETKELIEDADGMFRRVARYIAHDNNQQAEAFYDQMSSLKFLPNSPTLANAGTSQLNQLSACFVLPVPDSMDGIFQSIKDMAMIHKSGGGTGFSFSRIRPSGSSIGTTNGGVATGPVPFMKLFDSVSETVKQGGMRHGANMGILRWNHPDIRQFVHVKDDLSSLVNFNISVGVDNGFWDDRDLLDDICQSAWRSGDPGLVFLDGINSGRSNPVPSLGPIESTNPCGEQPLYPYDSCNLGSINLSKFVTPAKNVNFVELARTVKLAVRFLDNVVTRNEYPLPQIAEVSRNIRRIGLGVMGWADMLMKLEIPYGSSQSVALGADIMSFIQESADKESGRLGRVLGNFPMWSESIYGKDGVPMRNSTRTTIAPTGTISIIAGCSSGIEPVYALSMERRHKIDRNDPSRDVVMTEFNPVFEEYLLNRRGTVEKWEQMVLPEWFKTTAHEVHWTKHLRMQAAFQRFTDNAVSKTINFTNDATPEDIKQAYREAYDLGCLGITVYRDGCRNTQVLSHKPDTLTVNSISVQFTAELEAYPNAARRKLPRERTTIGKKFRVADTEGYIHVGFYGDGTPGEIFCNLDRVGSTVAGLVDSICTAVSIGVQYGVPWDNFVRKYKGSRFEPYGLTDDPDIRSCSSILDYIFRWFEKRFLTDANPATTGIIPLEPVATDDCPECGAKLIFSEGCEKCSMCTYNRCG